MRKKRSSATAKIARSRGNRLSTEDRKLQKIAATEFEAQQIDLCALPSNEELGAKMVFVRIAATQLTLTKPAMVRFVEGLDEGDVISEDGELSRLIDSLAHTQRQFKAFADMCDTAMARMLVAAAVAGLNSESRTL